MDGRWGRSALTSEEALRKDFSDENAPSLHARNLTFPPHALPSTHAAFPRYPTPFISSLLSPLVWLYGAPDLFDSYSAGILLVQVTTKGLF